MLKVHPVVKWSLLGFLSIIILIVCFGFWFMSLIPSEDERSHLSSTLPADLPYLSQDTIPTRGKILAVVSSHGIMGSSGKKTGYELTELSRPYYVFQANGFEVNIASPKGGNPPVVIDQDDMGAFDYAFQNDSIAQRKAQNTIPLKDVNPEEYDAVYFAGGKGAMFDFPDNANIKSIIQKLVERDKVIGAVCHGPAALVNVTLGDGKTYLANKSVSSFTNNEELFLIPEASTIFPFLLQDKLIDQGANFKEGKLYLKNVVRDGNLITGQNPWSTWAFAEAMIQQLGYPSIERKQTAEENTIDILNTYQAKGIDSAFHNTKMIIDQNGSIDRMLLGMHFIIAVMQYEPMEALDKIRLLVYAKELSNP